MGLTARPARGTAMVALLLTLTAVVALSVGCSRKPAAPDTPPSIRGVVTQTAQDTGGAILVVWSEDLGVDKMEYDAASIRLAEDGIVLEQDRELALTALEKGDLVSAWFVGPVAESYPVQAGASHIVVTGSYDGELPTPQGLESPLEQPE